MKFLAVVTAPYIYHICLFNKIRLIVRSLDLAGDSKGFDGKLVSMQVICRTNIQTAPGDIYGISPGANLSML